MKRLIVFRGLKRSGNHALINWIGGQHSFLFFNNIVKVAPILRGEAQRPEPSNFWEWLARRYHAQRVPCHAQLARIAMLGQSLIVSLEDHEPSYQPFHDPDCPVTHVLLLRDPANLFASRIRKGAKSTNPAYPYAMNASMRRVIDLWKSHAREFLGITDLLPAKVCISFDRWYSNVEYRRALSRHLGLEFSDAGFGRVTRYGYGSSFDGPWYTSHTRNMKVLDRRKQLNALESSLLESVMRDPELMELDRQVKSALLPVAA
jgi:hypothetical protein